MLILPLILLRLVSLGFVGDAVKRKLLDAMSFFPCHEVIKRLLGLGNSQGENLEVVLADEMTLAVYMSNKVRDVRKLHFTRTITLTNEASQHVLLLGRMTTVVLDNLGPENWAVTTTGSSITRWNVARHRERYSPGESDTHSELVDYSVIQYNS